MGAVTFKGFDDWIEIFRGGRQTDSAGVTREFDPGTLDSIVSNFNADDPPPAVVGHPRHDAPAYGWVSGVKREGDRLLARFADVEPAFAALVREGRFRKRSVALDRDGQGGFKLRHVGWLGAAAPAVEGLKRVEFESDGPDLEFMADWYTPSVLARAMRRLREFVVEHFGAEAADKVMPEFEIEAIGDHAKAAAREPDDDANAPSFSRAPDSGGDMQFAHTELSRMLRRLMSEKEVTTAALARAGGIDESTMGQILRGEIERPPDRRLRGFARALDIDVDRLFKAVGGKEEGVKMSKFTQADVDAAVAAALAEADGQRGTLEQQLAAERRERRRGEYSRAITAAIEAGRLTPAQAEGALEFMLALPEGEGAAFTFSRGTGAEAKEEQASPAVWFTAFLERLGKQVPVGEESDAGRRLDEGKPAAFAAPPGYSVDQEALRLHQRALDYQAKHQGVSYEAAILAVAD